MNPVGVRSQLVDALKLDLVGQEEAPKIVPRRNRIVHRQAVEKVPSGCA